jgi:K(+)-stimulated pyrophosphate-energized sodium pump
MEATGSYSGIPFGGLGPILLPLSIAAAGLLASIVSSYLVKVSDNGKADTNTVQAALNRGNWASILLSLGAAYGLIKIMLPEEITMSVFNSGEFGSATTTSMNVFWAVVIGMFVGGAISFITEFYTGLGKKPVMGIVQKSATGAATNIIAGLGTGMLSTALPVILFAGAIWGAYALAGFYGVGIAASAMMANTAMQLAIDAFGPIADNAGGVAEMSELPEEVRGRTDILDSVGNTTAAIGKGFAIASAALTALALFAAYVTFTGINGINIFDAKVLAALFIGGMIPVVFSALAMNSVGKAAMDMVNEVRRQFREIPGIMEGKGKPEYGKCVEISTKAALREMLLPGVITIITPIIIGFTMGAEALGAYMAGVTVSGVMWAIFQNNAGGAWDNAKKSFEKGVVINGETYYKKSEPHKAAVVGDTVGDPFKDTSGPSMNILIKLSCLVGLTLAPMLAHQQHGAEKDNEVKFTNALQGADGNYVANEGKDAITWMNKKSNGDTHSGNISFKDSEFTVENGLITKGEVDIDVVSIFANDSDDSSSNASLTGHMRDTSILAAAMFPNAKYLIKGSEICKEDGKIWLQGELDWRGYTRELWIPLDISNDNGTLVISSKFSLDRTEWGVMYGSKKTDVTTTKWAEDAVEIGFKFKAVKK